MLFYEDKTFTVATGTDQYIAVSATHHNQPMNNELTQPAPVGKPIRYLSVCSGMEAASVAWHPLGWMPVGFSEIEPFPCAILKHRFPNVPNYGDLTKYAEWPLAVGDVDLIVGGTPCQAFSVAGLRQGLADPRGNLALVFLGLVDRLRPKYVLWENVPGVLSSNRGEDFAAFVGALAELGYGFAWRCVDAQFFGVPQRRKRLYLLAVQGSGNWRTAAEILFEPEGLRGDFEASRKAGEKAPADAGAGVEAGCWWDGGQVSQTLDAVLSKGQTMPEKNRFPAVLTPYTASSFAQYAPGVGTVRASGGDLGGGSETLLTQPIPFDSMSLLERTPEIDDPRRGFGFGKEGDPMFTITKAHYHGVATTNQALSSSASDVNHYGAVLTPQVPMAVRRLTPEECEKLQGFEPGHSRISWKGKPEEDCPDGPRYKACGNSMAVPCMRWIGERINNYENKL